MAKNLCLLSLCILSLFSSSTPAADSSVRVMGVAGLVTVSWPVSPEETGFVTFNTDEQKPLIQAFAIARNGQGPARIIADVNPVTVLTVGTRDSKNPQGWGAFFDKVPTRPYQSYAVTLGRRLCETIKEGPRTTLRLAEASAGSGIL